uniref:Uncharacterized protein n=1 Tax=Hippocampus comes TaxID=109280 RepID=A0A3Q2Y917_HIPCM
FMLTFLLMAARAPAAAPLLTVKWLRGDEIVKSVSYSDRSSDDIDVTLHNISDSLTIWPYDVFLRNSSMNIIVESGWSLKAARCPKEVRSPKAVQSPKAAWSLKAARCPKEVRSPKAVQSPKAAWSLKAVRSPKAAQSLKAPRCPKEVWSLKAVRITIIFLMTDNYSPKNKKIQPLLIIKKIMIKNKPLPPNYSFF